ncbi:hypothetical protein ACFO4N_10850 [Camelliibacillus cellulosilyticus]|uniref:Phr family secreted Rap phosphatase inhibitor n=1 Tax=Camelliibacillus cellulosilyticus TaxID=2174486 RepID=A0ABV9GPP5_9BACL
MKTRIMKGIFAGIICSLTIGSFAFFASANHNGKQLSRDTYIPESIHYTYL